MDSKKRQEQGKNLYNTKQMKLSDPQKETLSIPDGGDNYTDDDTSSNSNSSNHNMKTMAKATTTSSSPSAFSSSSHKKSLAALCCCFLTNAWLIINVFPYSGFMALELIPSVNKENAGSYAGLLASFFMVGRTLSAYGWGKAADIYGRKVVLILSMSLTCIFSLLFGLAPTFRLALLWRFMIGLVNGVFTTSKTLVSEVAYGDERLETLGMGLVMGMWGWGFLVFPAISGALAEPIQQYPNSELLHPFESTLTRAPFLLPNLLSIVICLFTIIMVWVFIPETLPKEHLRSPKNIPHDLWNWFLVTIIPSLFSTITLRCNRDDMNNNNKCIEKKECKEYDISESRLDNTYGSTSKIDSVSSTCNSVQKGPQAENEVSTTTPLLSTASSSSSLTTTTTTTTTTTIATEKTTTNLTEKDNGGSNNATIKSLWSQQITRRHLMVFWCYAVVAVSIDEAFPLFCLSENAGLGVSEVTIGKILSGSGLLYAICQYFVYSWIVNKFGLYKSILIGGLLSCPPIYCIPLSLLFLDNTMTTTTATTTTTTTNDEDLSWRNYILLSIILATYRVFSMVFFASLATATNRTVLSEHRGTMNGLSNLGGSIAKGIAPIFAGCLVAFCISSGIFTPHVGIIFLFTVIGSLNVGTVIMAKLLLTQQKK